MRILVLSLISGLFMISLGCQTAQQKSSPPQMNSTTPFQAPLDPIAIPAKQDLALPALKVDLQKAAIGKRLFFDPRLSGDVQLSCASCHVPEQGFSDGKALSDAYPGTKGFRNTPTLINTAYKKQLGIPWFHDGRMGTDLNDVTRDQITESIWMNMDMRLMQERIKQDPMYITMFKEAGLGEPSNGKVRSLIPEYLNTLTSKNVPHDQGKLSVEAERGEKLFYGKGNCAYCHSGPLFSDGKAHNLGIPENPKIFKEPERHVAFIAFTMSMGIENYMNLRRDPGTHVVSHKADHTDMGKFMTPTLRELQHTAPYMHNGMFATLKEVIEFYDQGGGSTPHTDSLLRPLGLNAQEKSDLAAFLESLSGSPLTGPEFVETVIPSYQPITDWLSAEN